MTTKFVAWQTSSFFFTARLGYLSNRSPLARQWHHAFYLCLPSCPPHVQILCLGPIHLHFSIAYSDLLLQLFSVSLLQSAIIVARVLGAQKSCAGTDRLALSLYSTHRMYLFLLNKNDSHPIDPQSIHVVDWFGTVTKRREQS